MARFWSARTDVADRSRQSVACGTERLERHDLLATDTILDFSIPPDLPDGHHVYAAIWGTEVDAPTNQRVLQQKAGNWARLALQRLELHDDAGHLLLNGRRSVLRKITHESGIVVDGRLDPHALPPRQSPTWKSSKICSMASRTSPPGPRPGSNGS